MVTHCVAHSDKASHSVVDKSSRPHQDGLCHYLMTAPCKMRLCYYLKRLFRQNATTSVTDIDSNTGISEVPSLAGFASELSCTR